METKEYLKELTEEAYKQRREIMKAYNEKVNKEVEKFIVENNLQEAIAFVYVTYDPSHCGDYGYDYERLSKLKYNWDVYLGYKTCTLVFMRDTGERCNYLEDKEVLPIRLVLADNRKPQ